MRAKLSVMLVLVLFGLGFLETAQAREKITWPYLCYYPLYICENNRVVGGAGWDILNLMWKDMLEYEHEAVLLPVWDTLRLRKMLGGNRLFKK